MLNNNSKVLDAFEEEFSLNARVSEIKAWRVTYVFGAIAAVSLGILLFSLPFKKTEVFTILVDSSTGQMERLVQVAPTTIKDQKLLKESLLVAYVSDRESYITAGIHERLESIQRKSAGKARASLIKLWTNSNDNVDYPPKIYGGDSEVTVKVRSISFVNDNVAQVRFFKSLSSRVKGNTTAPFIATIEFEFDNGRVTSLARAWENPLGFKITSYTVNAETLDKGK